MTKYFFAALCCVALTSCSSSSSTSGSGDSTENTVLTGVFLDSAVQGLAYATNTQNGITDQDGTINYLADEEVTLSIGQLSLPSFLTSEIMSPLNVFGVSEASDVRVVNLAILLQSMDSDSNPENGIEIQTSAGDSAPVNIDFSQETLAFIEDSSVINLVSNSGSTGIVSADVAQRHLQNTLANENVLVRLGPLDYTMAVIGNTATYSSGSSYYYRADGTRFAMELSGEIVETPWVLDSSENICETTTRGTLFCIADAPNLLLTQTVGSNVFNYFDDDFVDVFTVSEGDSLGLAN